VLKAKNAQQNVSGAIYILPDNILVTFDRQNLMTRIYANLKNKLAKKYSSVGSIDSNCNLLN
jgi:hypothetical protein